jgi:cold shock CspA family protein
VRVGFIAKVIYDRKFGFIKSEHFRDDVFFHFSKLQGIQGRFLEEGQEVEFEINEILRLDEQKLEATLVQPATRPLSKSLDEKAISSMQASHHPKARQRKPLWREKEIPADPNGAISPLATETDEPVSNEATLKDETS